MNTLLNTNDIVRITKVSRKTIWKWRKANKFPKPCDVNGTLRWKQTDIDNWINGL